MAGTLYLCATPIGNLEDITFRVLRTLKEADLIAAEDTRHSIKLLNHFEIKTPMTSYHEYNKVEKAAYLVSQMAQGRQDIRTLWLRQMIRPDGTPSLIIVVDHTGTQAEVFEAVAEAARPHFGRLPVDMIPYGTSFAEAATEGVEPFFRREG